MWVPDNCDRGDWDMSLTSTCIGLAIAVMPVALATATLAAQAGLITKPSRYSVEETISRFEAAVNARAAAGFKVFTRIDHAAAAKEAGLDMRPRTVIVFGNPKQGTPTMVKTAPLAIDLPMKALVWEDDEGRVWLSYNSAGYLSRTIYPRHGLPHAPPADALVKTLDEMTDAATK
jgi:uncharacterized protein (DUF302 family)